MRAFIAIEIPDGVRREINSLRQRMACGRLDAKWVEPENMHLTLKFLGDIDPKLVPEIASAMRQATAGVQRLELAVKGVGSFPPRGVPRVLWLGILDEEGILGTIAERLEALLARLGIPPEGRKFTPHLTLARLRSRRGVDELLERVAQFSNIEIGGFSADRLVLFESQLTRHGAIHTPMATQPLGQ